MSMPAFDPVKQVRNDVIFHQVLYGESCTAVARLHDVTPSRVNGIVYEEAHRRNPALWQRRGYWALRFLRNHAAEFTGGRPFDSPLDTEP
jgi:hypothetical protein